MSEGLNQLGALGGCTSFVSTTTVIPLFPDGWAASAGGFPAMKDNVAFLMKDLVLLAVSFYMLKQGLRRMSLSDTSRAATLNLGHDEMSDRPALKSA
jgi:uncharacterized membrane protein YkgB